MATTDSDGLEKDIELARLEAAFWESTHGVRSSNVALRTIQSSLMEELLDLEVDKRRCLTRRVEDMELEFAHMKVCISILLCISVVMVIDCSLDDMERGSETIEREV